MNYWGYEIDTIVYTILKRWSELEGTQHFFGAMDHFMNFHQLSPTMTIIFGSGSRGNSSWVYITETMQCPLLGGLSEIATHGEHGMCHAVKTHSLGKHNLQRN